MVEMRDERGTVLEILLEIVRVAVHIDGVIIKARRSANNNKGVRYTGRHSQGNRKKKQNRGKQGQTVTVKET